MVCRMQKKSNIISIIKKKIYPFYHRIKTGTIVKSKKRDWVFARIACMGQDVYKLLDLNLPLYNIQKGRVDYLNRLKQNNQIRTKANQTIPYLFRKDIEPLIRQQDSFNWTKLGLPKLILIDSYSELTDQLFVNRKNNWEFCSNYSDLKITNEFNIHFEVIGLMPIDLSEENYRNFFKNVFDKFPNTPIVFLHFPVKLEKRDKFKIRYKYILESIEKLSIEFDNLFSIKIDDNIVDWPEFQVPGIENFPYHYNKATYMAFAEEVKKLNLIN